MLDSIKVLPKKVSLTSVVTRKPLHCFGNPHLCPVDLFKVDNDGGDVDAAQHQDVGHIRADLPHPLEGGGRQERFAEGGGHVGQKEGGQEPRFPFPPHGAPTAPSRLLRRRCCPTLLYPSRSRPVRPVQVEAGRQFGRRSLDRRTGRA